MSYSYNFLREILLKRKKPKQQKITLKVSKEDNKIGKDKLGLKESEGKKGSRHVSHVLPSPARSAKTHVLNMNEC